jgi:hypothetical protein
VRFPSNLRPSRHHCQKHLSRERRRLDFSPRRGLADFGLSPRNAANRCSFHEHRTLRHCLSSLGGNPLSVMPMGARQCEWLWFSISPGPSEVRGALRTSRTDPTPYEHCTTHGPSTLRQRTPPYRVEWNFTMVD